MEPKIVEGKFEKHNVHLVTLSTCMWCHRLKNKLKEKNIKYSYIDIDLLPYNQKQMLKRDLQKHKPRLAFPMMFVDEEFVPNARIDAQIEELLLDN